MQRTVKIIGSIIGLLVILAIAAVICLVVFVNPNDFKEQINHKVTAVTGRQLAINGEIKWSFFPWLGLELNAVSLSNAPGFGEQPFAQINHADVKVQLIPLLKGEVKIGKLSLDGLRLNLMKNKQGVTNWQDLTEQAQTSAKQSTDTNNNDNYKTANKLKFDVQGVNINNSNITWQNQQTGQNIAINNLTMKTGRLALTKTFPLSMQFDIISNQPNLTGNFSLNSEVSGDPSTQVYAFNNLKLISTLTDKAYANGKLIINLQGNINADLQKEIATINTLNAKIANLQIQGDLQAQQILSNWQLQGQIKIPAFDLKQLLTALGQPLPARKSAKALTQVAVSSDLQASANSLQLNNLNAQLDNTHASGNLVINDFNKKIMAFNLKMDQIVADDYLAVKPANNPTNNISAITASNNSAVTKQSLLPINTLRNLNSQGQLQIGNLHLNKLVASSINMQIKAQGGLINLSSLSAALYQGNYNGNMTLDVRGKTPIITTDNKLSNIKIEPLMQDLINITKLQMSGTGNINIHLTTQGNTEAAIISHLNGQGNVALTNGVVKGINLPYWISVAKALINNSAPPAMNGSNQTAFGNLTGTFTASNGIVSNNDLLIDAPSFQAKGNGTANLVSQQLSYKLITQLMIPAAHKPQGDAIPIKITGNFSNIHIQPDVDTLLKQQLQKQIKTRVTKELQKSLGDEAGKAAGDKLNSVLQQFL